MKTIVKLTIIAMLASFALLSQSCSSLINSSIDKIYYRVDLSSTPGDARVMFQGKKIGTTPDQFVVTKKYVNKNNSAQFQIEKEGYKSKTVTITREQFEAGAKVDVTLLPIDAPEPEPQRVSRDNPGATDMEQAIIRWYIDSDPRGARLSYRVISNVPTEVKNTNETYLTTTPYEETRPFAIPGLTYDNATNVTIELKISKRGFEDQVKRYNVRQALDQQEISGFFELVPKD